MKAAEQLVDLIGADVVVSVGRGICKDVREGHRAGRSSWQPLLGGGVVGGIPCRYRLPAG